MRIVVSHFLSAINEDMITIKQLQTSQSVIISNVCHELTYADDVESIGKGPAASHVVQYG